MKILRPAVVLVAMAGLGAAACGGGRTTSTSTNTSSNSGGSSSSTSSGSNSNSQSVCPAATTSSGTLDCTKLPLGDQNFSISGPAVGSVFVCNVPQGGGGAQHTGPWIDAAAGTWNGDEKVAVEGSVGWNGTFSPTLNGDTRTITGNGEPEPPVTTGVFPIQSTDPAYQYDRNPNSIAAQNYSFSLPANPVAAITPGCLTAGAIGITVTGVAIFDGFDADGNDAVANEVQDACHGHPDGSDQYHYHGWLQTCVPDSGSATQNSSLLGYAADGYGIYGPWYNGKILTSADLDACHGTTSTVLWNGKEQSVYHYVSTYDFPYTLGCFHGSTIVRQFQ